MSVLDRIAGTRVLVIGDVMLDEYLWGEVERISPEAPVPIVHVRKRTYAPGGAGNAAVAITALGGRCVLVSVMGDDESSAHLRDALTAHAVDLAGVERDSRRPTTVKSRLLARGQHVVRMDSEDRTPLTAELTKALLRRACDKISSVDAVLISDYGKGVVSGALARAVIAAAAQAGRPVIADPTGISYRHYRGAAIITPSVDELAAALGRHIRNDDELRAASDAMVELLPGTDILVTRGPQGMRLVRRSGEPLDIPTRARTVFDVTGAGDTVAGTIALALGSGLDTVTALHLANTAAGMVVGKVGTAHVTAAELAPLL